MNRNTQLAFAAFLVAYALELDPEAPAEGAAATATGGEPAKRRGRPPGSTAAAAEPAAPVGKTYEELKEIIRPVVEDGQQEAVKKLIVKHGGAVLKDIPAQNHEAFTKDVQALII